jgi:hypothetical protein
MDAGVDAGLSTDAGTRSFSLGFSPWPWDATTAAVDWTWTHLLENGDLVSNHLEQGVCWDEALNSTQFPSDFVSTLTNERARVPATHKVLLSLSPLNTGRNGLSAARTSAINAPLSAPWSGYAFNAPQVKTAFTNFVKRVIDSTSPAFVITGIEVNLLRTHQPEQVWAQYVELQCHVYSQLKAAGYQQPIGVSLVTQALYHPELYATEHAFDAQLKALRDLEPCVDVIAWSVHPFISGLLAETFPDDYFTTIFALTTKPQAISESSYPAQVWSLAAGTPTWNGTPEKQARFATRLLAAAQQQRLKYVVWFAVRDYDQLWARPANQGGLGQSELALIWRDTGLYDEAGAPRAALTTWREWLTR